MTHTEQIAQAFRKGYLKVAKKKIKAAIRAKIANSPYAESFMNSTLPFSHYYVYNGVAKDAGYTWIIQYLSELRRDM
jgi:hypothetical protein